MIKFIRQNTLLFALASFTLGLAPFFPEPHVWDKLKRVFLRTHPMAGIDWFDLFLHGTPWLLLIISIYLKFKKK